MKITDAHKAQIVDAVTAAFKMDLARAISTVQIEPGEVLSIQKTFDVLIPAEGKEPLKFFNYNAMRAFQS